MDQTSPQNMLSGWEEEFISLQNESDALYIASFSESGSLLYANRAMEAILKGEPCESLKNPVFNKLLQSDSTELIIFEGILTVGDLSNFTSIHAKIYRKKGKILIIGYVDSKELLKQNEIALNLNREINNLQRQLIKEKTTIEHTLKELNESMEKIKVLSGLLPICSNCKKIRDDQGYWQAVEGYIMKHSDAKFTHGVCPDCMKKLYPGYRKD